MQFFMVFLFSGAFIFAKFFLFLITRTGDFEIALITKNKQIFSKKLITYYHNFYPLGFYRFSVPFYIKNTQSS